MLDPDTVGAAIAAKVQTMKPTPGTPVTDAQLTALWKAIVKEIYDGLAAGQVAPGTFTTAVGGGPVTGIGGPIT